MEKPLRESSADFHAAAQSILRLINSAPVYFAAFLRYAAGFFFTVSAQPGQQT
jgi:hypothetical protein